MIKLHKHLAYFTVLDAFKTLKTCALCGLEKDTMHKYFDTLLYESVNDAEIRSELIRSKGYCNRHAFDLIKFGDGLGTAILYQDQLNLTLNILSSSDIKSNYINTILYHPLCPACKKQMEARTQYISVFIDALTDQEMKDAYETSAGICLPHLIIINQIIKNAKLLDYLISIERQNISTLIAEVKEFCRKHDYRFSDETYGEEKDSWIRAVTKMVGIHGIL